MERYFMIIIGISLALVTALGDALIKKASLKTFVSSWYLILGAAIIYAATAFGWFFVLKKIKLSNAVVIYTLSLVLFVVAISVIYFKEDLKLIEYIGIGLAIISLLILSRFA